MPYGRLNLKYLWTQTDFGVSHAQRPQKDTKGKNKLHPLKVPFSMHALFMHLASISLKEL